MGRPVTNAIRDRQIKRMRRRGMKPIEIAGALGLSRSAVGAVCRGLHMSRRSWGPIRPAFESNVGLFAEDPYDLPPAAKAFLYGPRPL